MSSNSNSSIDKAALIAEITAAFDGVSREDGITLYQADVIDGYGSPEAEAAARAKDTETRWQDVPQDAIRWTGAVLTFLDPKGFRYYLPAYMICYLNHVDDEDHNAVGHSWDVVFHLGGGDTRPLDEYFLSRFTLLSAEQSRAVALFLTYLAEREEILKGQSEELRQQEIARGEVSKADSDARQEAARQYGMEAGLPENEAQWALDRYWGQFL